MMNNFITRLSQDQVKEIADLLMEPEEEQGSISYLFTGNHMVLEIVKNRIIDGKNTTHINRYRVYDYRIEPEGRLLPEGTDSQYRLLMHHHFGTPYTTNYLFYY